MPCVNTGKHAMQKLSQKLLHVGPVESAFPSVIYDSFCCQCHSLLVEVVHFANSGSKGKSNLHQSCREVSETLLNPGIDATQVLCLKSRLDRCAGEHVHRTRCSP